MLDKELLIKLMQIILLIIAGMLIRQILEEWKDWNVERALYAARRKDERAAQHTEPMQTAQPIREEPVNELEQLRKADRMPLSVLARMKLQLMTTGHAGASRIYGRWSGKK